MNDANKTMNFVVVFYKVRSLNNGLSQEACEKLCTSFKFSKRGNEFLFDEKANPQYSNHIVRSLLTLNSNQILEVDTLDTKFSVEEKNYQVISWLSCVTYLNPFHIKGVINNEYYRAAFSIFSDDLDDVENSIS